VDSIDFGVEGGDCPRLWSKSSYRSMGTTGDPVPVGQRDVPVNHFTG
jgi:hypothetical protein